MYIVSTYLKVSNKFRQIPLSWILVYESLVVIGCTIEVLLSSSPSESLLFSRFSNVLFSSASCLFTNWINSRLLALDFPLFEMDILDISHVEQAQLTVLNYMQSSILWFYTTNNTYIILDYLVFNNLYAVIQHYNISFLIQCTYFYINGKTYHGEQNIQTVHTSKVHSKRTNVLYALHVQYEFETWTSPTSQ